MPAGSTGRSSRTWDQNAVPARPLYKHCLYFGIGLHLLGALVTLISFRFSKPLLSVLSVAVCAGSESAEPSEKSRQPCLSQKSLCSFASQLSAFWVSGLQTRALWTTPAKRCKSQQRRQTNCHGLFTCLAMPTRAPDCGGWHGS